MSYMTCHNSTNFMNRRGHHLPLINCPSCKHHVCDFSNMMQCETCQIVVPHWNLPPQDVRCVADGHCHEDNHNHCCDTEACVASVFGQFNRLTTTSNHNTMQNTDPFAHCPRCHGGYCDFVNRDQCYMCKFDLHDNQLPHLHCLRQGEHCDPNHSLCCKEETCIAQAFGRFYPSSMHSSTRPTISTVTHTDTFVFCPICTDQFCSTTEIHHNCVGCIYHYDHQTTACVKQWHEHECRSGNHHICCTTTECITSLLGQRYGSTAIQQPGPHTDPFAHCPRCHGGYCDFVNRDQCYMCKFDLHNKQLPHVHCLKHGEHCHTNDKTLCCKEETCIAQAFGGFYPISVQPPVHTTIGTTTGSNNQITSQQVNLVHCPLCHSGKCNVTNFIKCDLCKIAYNLNDPTAVPVAQCDNTNKCTDGPNLFCCKTDQCIISALASYFKNINSSTTSVGTVATGHSVQNITVPVTLKSTAQSSSVVPKTTHALTPNPTTAGTTSSSSIGMTAAASSTTNGSPSTLTTTPNNCMDNISNCNSMKMIGVCHALPQQKVSYDIAFLNCRATCNLCSETYQPLIPTTTTTKPSTSCHVCGDYYQGIPCDTLSVYTGHTIPCSGANSYCMTDIVHENNNVKIYKRCVDETVCRNQWLSQTSDQDHCTNYGNVAISRDFSCHFCCTSDGCNQGLLPKTSTLYVKP
ncbi:uncharacterized protein LOC130052300 isoform X2 [Ostrea edulis]|uniref:uncharacterized protein LOC130052300 isoform X2 n=1 Tax=Ostrea edulis TaxID=37623 RepID=UPI0024AF1659|nr:uncharacterized protein LOC130052300 isoform X2 [Ostrea edulis]